MSENRKETVSPDIVYTHLSTEMRHYRDHELMAASWFTSILLANSWGASSQGSTPRQGLRWE